MQIKKDISLKPYNTFNIDVEAKYFAEVFSESEIIDLLSNDIYKSTEKLFIGGGSNILFKTNFDGIIIQLKNNSIDIIAENDESVEIKVDAGVCWDDFVKYAVERNYFGIENLSLIPGNVGAVPIQNIGAYGVEIEQVIKSVNLVMLDNLNKKVFQNSECRFGYRDSIFKNELKNRFVITSVVFILSKNRNVNLEYAPLKNKFEHKNISEITCEDIRKEVISIRESKLPDPKIIGNAGSFFKNPIISKEKYDELKIRYLDLNGYPENTNSIKISAGWLIEKCGLKGKRVGNVGVHKMQALVIVNYGNASGKEIVDFSKMIEREVQKKFDIKLINEVNII
jgi:UDP-N-acetylmuramate dehydrogenase